MDRALVLAEIMRNDPERWRMLGLVRDLELPDCWIAAGFVRNAVWHHLHARTPMPHVGDVDVVWFDSSRVDRCMDRELEVRLSRLDPNSTWSVKNQARMHARNGDHPYSSTQDAMRHWPETATAVAARRTDRDSVEIMSAFGLDDLFSLILRPTFAFTGDRYPIYRDRVRTKEWLAIWPSLTLLDA